MMTRKNPLSDLQGMLSLIGASSNPFSPLIEAFNNSLESIFKSEQSINRAITVEVHFNDSDEHAKQLDFIEISDSGTGFDNESYSRYERLLDRTKGFNNRGSGRLQYLHRFEEISISSTYIENGTFYERSFKSSKENFIYDEKGPTPVEVGFCKTTVTLNHLRDNKRDNEAYTKLQFNSFVSWVKSQFALRAYLESKKGKIFPTITLKFSYLIADSESLVINPTDFPPPIDSGEFFVNYQEPFDDHGNIGWRNVHGSKKETFHWCVFSFLATEVDVHGAFLCSKDIPVEEIKNPALKKSNGLSGNRLVTAFHGEYLDRPDNVSHSVDSFLIPNKSDVKVISNSLFDSEGHVYLDDIKEKANSQLKSIYKEVEVAQNAAERNVMTIARELGISQHIALNVKKTVKLNDDEETIIKNLHIEEAKYVADKSHKARTVLKQLEYLDPI
jgi:hypothetical protein